eukprot:482611_1
MPLLNGRSIKFVSHPADLTSSTKVFQIRFTGEVFKEYCDYSTRLDFYRQSKFACKYTGKTGFTYEQALAHEIQSKAAITQQIPSEYLPLILETIQFSQLKLSELVNTIHQKLIDHVNKTQPTLDSAMNTNTNTNQPKPKSSKKASKKGPLKKIQIRTQIRVAANQQNFKNAPWILHDQIAKKHNISKQMPPDLQALITQYLQQRTKKRSRSKSKAKSTDPKIKTKTKPEKPAKPAKPVSLIHSLCIQSTNKSFKYPCDDQLLLMYDKLENKQIIEYDTFWRNIDKIGVSRGSDAVEHETESYSNLAFIDYNMLYDDNTEQQTLSRRNLRIMKHRQLNDMFHKIWKLWSFVTVFHEEIGLTPFPISYLMDALCYNKRCVVMDELMLCLLDIIRRHFIWYLDQQTQDKKHAKRKQIASRKKARKQRERAAKKKPKNDKEEMDMSEDEDTESEEEDDANDEDYEVTDTEEDEEEDYTETDESSDDDDMDLSDDEEADEWMMDVLNELNFTREALNNGFRLEILRNYLQFRCNSSDDEDDALLHDILPVNTAVISDAIWDRLCNIRQYLTLGIEAQLEIVKVLFEDVQQTQVLRQMMNDRITRYQETKQVMKGIEDEHTRTVKEEKAKLRAIRSEFLNKKKLLKVKKTATSTSASSSASSSASKATSTSPNKENNGTKANSKSVSTAAVKGTSRQQEMARQKEEKEKEELLMMEEKEREDLKRDVVKLDHKYQNARDLMSVMLKEKEGKMMYRKYELWKECRTQLMELGSDRFNNKYFWNAWSDGRIFVLHANGLYHEEGDASVTKRLIALNECEGIKCYNEWEVTQMMKRDDAGANSFCWSYVSTSTQFYNLLMVLDERGTRESKLLLMLKALKNDIIQTMKVVGNDDYKEEEVKEAMDVDETEAPTQLRRSKRATKQITNNTHSNKGFLSYQNKIKRK